jgi:hypothetical protein
MRALFLLRSIGMNSKHLLYAAAIAVILLNAGCNCGKKDGNNPPNDNRKAIVHQISN